MQYSVFTGWHSPAWGIKQLQWSWWPYLTGASSGGTSRLNKLHRRIRIQDPPDREAAGAFPWSASQNHLVLSAHGEEEEGIFPNASQREESLASYWTHCHILIGSVIYFTQWLEDEEQGEQGLGGGRLWEAPRTPCGSFPLALGEVKWLKTDTFKQLQQHQGESRRPWRHILVCMDSLPALWKCPQVPRPFQSPRRRVPHCSSPQFSHLIIAPS